MVLTLGNNRKRDDSNPGSTITKKSQVRPRDKNI